jgi:putative hydrolase of the HAD superfamily
MSISINWNHIQNVLLDMDGTLLDLYFDDYFWREYVPLRFAEKHGMELPHAREEVFTRYRLARGSLDWYCVDYWTTQLELDIASLKKEVDHLIALHPFVIEFLDTVRSLRKRAVLVTNAHGKSVELKMERTRLDSHLDALVCAHDFGLPKEDVAFWERLQQVEPFENQSTLLIDDNQQVLQSARSYGIRHLVTIIRPNTQAPDQTSLEFPAIRSFKELMPS